MTEQVPSIGRVVHFVYGDQHVPALITDPEYRIIEPAIDDPPIQQALTVFPVGAPPFTTTAIYNQGGAPATWHWPEYVPAKA
jgi:hypothetical protein